MLSAVVEVCKIKRDLVIQFLHLLRKTYRFPRYAVIILSACQVLPFYVAGRYHLRVYIFSKYNSLDHFIEFTLGPDLDNLGIF